MKNDLTTIKQASFFRRVLALIMDGSITIFAFFAFFVLVFSPIATKAFHYKDLAAEGKQLQLDSHLYVLVNEDDKNNTPLTNLEEENLEFYKEHIKYYYCVFKTTLAEDKDEKIDNGSGEMVLPKDYYTEAWFNEKFASVTDLESAKNASYDALVDFVPYIKDISNKIKGCEYFMVLPSYFLSFSIFYILIPLLSKNGETLGKRTLKLDFISYDGYSVKKRQIVARQVFLFVYVGIFGFFLTIGIGSFALIGLGTLIYLIAAFISKTNRSFADLIAYTYLVDATTSVWFESPEQEKAKNIEIENRLETYEKHKEKDKNIIQIGSEIVNEDVKKEIEDSKQKNPHENSRK